MTKLQGKRKDALNLRLNRFGKQICFLSIFLLLPLINLASEKPRLAIVSLELMDNGDIKSRSLPKLRKKLTAKLSGSFRVLSSAELEKLFLPLLKDELRQELQYAQDSYYSFQFEKAVFLLGGRQDKEALIWKALSYFSEDKLEEARAQVFSWAVKYPDDILSPKDFSPKFLKFTESIKKMIGQSSNAKKEIPAINPADFSTNVFEKSWKRRFGRVIVKSGVEQVMCVEMYPVGWNQKLRVFLFKLEGEGSVIRKEIEFIREPDWEEASKILVNTMFSVDTQPSEK